MKSNQYWKDRANERMAEYHKNSDKTIFKINNAYNKAIEDINNDINKIFFKFQTDSGLSIEEAKALLNSKISEKELENIRAKIAYIEDKDLKQYLMAQLNAKAYNARMSRLEALKESIYINTKKAAEVELKQSELGYINNINKAYYKNIYDIQKGTGVVTEFATMPVSTIEEILKNNWSGKHYSERVWGNSDVLASKLEEVVTSGLMSGKSSKKMAVELEELSTYGKMAAERLVRTETTYVTNMAELESYKELDIDKYIFVATLDLRTSPMCREMDGKIIEVSKGIPGENLPPLHPWCRSTKRAYFEGMTRRRRARDPETGKNYIVEDMDYKEWYQKCVVDKYGEQKAETFQKMIRNKASDRKQFNKFKEVLGKDSPKTLKDFQELKYNDIEEFRKLKELYEYATVKQLLKEHNINIIDRADTSNYIVNNYYPKITKLRGHALENLQQKSDRYNMTKEKAQEFVNNAKVVLYDKDRETIKFISDVGYAVLNFDNELVTAVPQKWRKKYEKFIREV
ncbi:minor capsid protein [Clostridium cadaveris]|uniref:minor capsid protein n=1 Tax=Clostridium cadaveris TaxID=1529 RepID=UPI00041EC45E|nr:minor capsid protein [Clostridium cadaveris]